MAEPGENFKEAILILHIPDRVAYLLPIVCFKVSNDSHFALDESILITFYEARICFELNLFWLIK